MHWHHHDNRTHANFQVRGGPPNCTLIGWFKNVRLFISLLYSVVPTNLTMIKHNSHNILPCKLHNLTIEDWVYSPPRSGNWWSNTLKVWQGRWSTARCWSWSSWPSHLALRRGPRTPGHQNWRLRRWSWRSRVDPNLRKHLGWWVLDLALWKECYLLLGEGHRRIRALQNLSSFPNISRLTMIDSISLLLRGVSDFFSWVLHIQTYRSFKMYFLLRLL